MVSRRKSGPSEVMTLMGRGKNWRGDYEQMVGRQWAGFAGVHLGGQVAGQGGRAEQELPGANGRRIPHCPMRCDANNIYDLAIMRNVQKWRPCLPARVGVNMWS